ncbi:XRE family transcriptional regulator, partial [Pimelobacter simplex]|nr:XRE family transcriptional regulator [Pimelobacter simplex]
MADPDPRVDLVWGPYARALGINLQRARAERGLSQEEVARQAGI